MGWQDRDYSQSGYEGRGGSMMAGGFMWPRVTPMVKKLLIANVAVFVAQIIFQGSQNLENVGAFVFEPAVHQGQLWRFVSYQYLHGGAGHLFWNMLGLYFLGSLMERSWGQRKFFLLYTFFGVAGATLYAVLVGFGVLPRDAWMIGASGSVLGLIGACAVAAPQIRLLLLFMFPVRIRTVAILFAAIYALNVMYSQDGADACHLGGLAVGALWVWLESKGIIRWSGRVQGSVGPTGRKWVQVKIRKGAWERKMKRQQAQQAQIDRILKKVHEEGLGSLSRQEKKTLQQASKNGA
ncbi:MAG: rhomboid family intramembrane serine protease [Phycisphaerae bacterium]|nr:rhomboid family intramembrane serine protease [Phycisphaerae bacterium]